MDKELEGDYHGLFEGSILELVWRDWG